MPGKPPDLNSAMAAHTPVVQCPAVVAQKVRQFREHIEVYKSGAYSEAQLRVDFINPLLEGLGWDVDNKDGYAEATQ